MFKENTAFNKYKSMFNEIREEGEEEKNTSIYYISTAKYFKVNRIIPIRSVQNTL